MKSKSPADIYTLTDYLVGELSVEKNAEVERELGAQPEAREMVSSLQLAQDAMRDPTYSHVNVDVISQRLHARIGEVDRLGAAPAHRTEYGRSPLVNHGGHGWLRRLKDSGWHALSAALIVIIALWGYSSLSDNTDNSVLASQTIYTTPPGERANIRLIDGTEVILNVGSTLMIPANFGQTNRTLTLQGEALFTVVQHSKTPFIVSAGNTVSKVLGTTFGVRAYGDDTVVRVVVQDGRVMTNNTVISPNDMVEVNRDGRHIMMHDVPIDNYTAFAMGTLVFTDVRLVDALPSLNRWFNADVIIADERLKSKLLTATYGKGSIGDLSEYLSATFGATVVRDGPRLILYSR